MNSPRVSSLRRVPFNRRTTDFVRLDVKKDYYDRNKLKPKYNTYCYLNFITLFELKL